MEKARAKLTLVIDDSGAWDGLYVDGKIVVQDGTLYAWDVLEALETTLGIEVETLNVAMPDNARRLPAALAKAREWKIES